jgi:hypothetical protein
MIYHINYGCKDKDVQRIKKKFLNVISIEYQTGELIPEIPALRNSIVNVRCTDDAGQQFIVEMQMYWSERHVN